MKYLGKRRAFAAEHRSYAADGDDRDAEPEDDLLERCSLIEELRTRHRRGRNRKTGLRPPEPGRRDRCAECAALSMFEMVKTARCPRCEMMAVVNPID